MKRSIWHTSSFLLIALISTSFALAGCSKKDSSVDPEDKEEASSAGNILFESVQDGIHNFDFSSTADERIMDGRYPSRMPDGRIAFVLEYPERIMISNADGTGQKEFFKDNNMILMSPEASPDGKYIAFVNVSSSFQNVPGTFIYKTDGTKLLELEGLFHPSWTPDGRLVMSGSYNSTFQPQTPHSEGLYITDKQFTTLTRIDPGMKEPLMPSVSPDGKLVAFVLNGHIWEINIDGTGAKQITKGDSDEKYPSWSPDGKYIAFNGFVSGSLIGIVPSGELTEVSSAAKCWVFSKKSEGLNSESQITWY